MDNIGLSKKKISYLYEVPIFYLLLAVLNYLMFPLSPGYIGIEPHPYWSGILLFAFRYGMAAGFFSGVISLVLYFLSTWLLGERYLFQDLPFYFLPSCFVLVGILVGAGIERYRDRLTTLNKLKGQLIGKIESLDVEMNTQREIISGLEKRIVTKMTTLVTLYEGARKLETNNLEDLYQAVVDFVAKTTDATEVALYLKGVQGFEVRTTHGWQNENSWPRKLGFHEGITGRSGTSGKVVSVRDLIKATDEAHLSGLNFNDSLVSGPVRQGEQGEVIGVVSLQALDFLQFNSSTISLFQFLLSWVSRALGRAHYIQNMRKTEIIDPEFGLYTQGHFYARAGEEFARSKTYYLPLSIAMVRVNGLNQLGETQRRTVLLAVGEFLRQMSRGMDVVARLEEREVDFGILMVTTSQPQAEEVRQRILTGFSGLGLKAQVSLSVEVASFTPQSESVQSLIRKAKEDLHYVRSA